MVREYRMGIRSRLIINNNMVRKRVEGMKVRRSETTFAALNTGYGKSSRKRYVYCSDESHWDDVNFTTNSNEFHTRH